MSTPARRTGCYCKVSDDDVGRRCASVSELASSFFHFTFPNAAAIGSSRCREVDLVEFTVDRPNLGGDP